MVSKMFGLSSKKKKVVNMVIGVVPIFMMYDFSGKKVSMKMLSHNISSHTLALSTWFIVRNRTSMVVIAFRGAIKACSRFKFFTSGVERFFTENTGNIKSFSFRFIDSVTVKSLKDSGPGDAKHIGDFLHSEVLCYV